MERAYFANYERWPAWKLAVGEVDGEPVVIILQRVADASTPYSAVRLDLVGERIEHIVDYLHCPWVIPAAASVGAG